jgi:predicted 3-demethylubiquinone-9 3-methyltransferase (glyoxalase superfamily)
MTVEGQDKDKKTLCVWFNRKGEKCSDSFFAQTLKNSELINAVEVLSPEETLSIQETKVEETAEQKIKNRQTKKHHNEEQPSVD